MEDVLAIIFIFGIPGLIGFTFTPMGKAITDRIRYGGQARPVEPDHALYEEVDHLRGEVAELAERLDFAERLLSQQAEARALEKGS